MSEYYYQRDDVVFGPVPGPVLRDLIISGVIVKSTLVRKGSRDWVVAGDVKGLEQFWPESVIEPTVEEPRKLAFYQWCGLVALFCFAILILFPDAVRENPPTDHPFLVRVYVLVSICSFGTWMFGAIKKYNDEHPIEPNPSQSESGQSDQVRVSSPKPGVPSCWLSRPGPNPYAAMGLLFAGDLVRRINNGIERRSEEQKARERENEFIDKLSQKLKS